MLSKRKADCTTAQEHPHSHRYITRRERALLRWYRRLGKEDRAHIVRFVSALAMANAPLENLPD